MKPWQTIARLEWGMASLGAGLALFVIMMITILGVFGRYVLGTDLIPGGYNLIERVAFPLLVFLAVPLAYREGRFPRFDVLESHLPPRVGKWVKAFVLVVECVVFGIVLYFSVLFAWDAVASGRQMQIGTRLWPAWPVMIMMPLAFALVWMEMLRRGWQSIRSAPAHVGSHGRQ